MLGQGTGEKQRSCRFHDVMGALIAQGEDFFVLLDRILKPSL